MTVKIRNETVSDVPAIEAVTICAFLTAPHTSHTEQFIVNALRKAGVLAVSLVADAEGTVIGHVAVSPISISDGASGWFGLGPISVAPQHQRCGVGSRLMRGALRSLRERGAAGCVLLGEPEYYGRFGFRAEPDLTLPHVRLNTSRRSHSTHLGRTVLSRIMRRSMRESSASFTVITI